MRNFTRYQVLLFLTQIVCFFTLTAEASPAYRGAVTRLEADGTEVCLYLHGDEHFNYATSADGYAVAMSADGYYRYLDSQWRPTGPRLAAGDSEVVKQFKSAQQAADMREDIARRRLSATAPAAKRQPRAGRFPTSGTPRSLVLLVEFADQKFASATPLADFNALLNSESYTANGATGSCRSYYSDNSMGKFAPVFDVYGPVTLSQGYAYYGEDNPLTGSDLRATDMIVEACEALDGDVNFAEYDTDGDGIIDNVYVFYAGYGAADSGLSDRVWPHSYDFGRDERRVVLDGKQLGNYACSNEVSYVTHRMTGIGTFVHEFGHCLGLPDMYNSANQNASFTPGEWDFMDYGMYNNQGRTPPYITAYERYFLGWLEPQELDQPDNLTLGNIADNTTYRISTNLPDEYFLLENRQQQGWDAYIPGHGMLVWHIDYVKALWDDNRVNTNPSHQYVDILEADNLRSLDNVAGDPFPGTAGITAITDETQPSMRTWLGLGFGKTVTEIAETPEGLITFRYRGGATLPGAPADVRLEEATPVSLKVSWSAVEGATHYLVSLRSMADGMAVGNYDDCNAGAATEFLFENLDPQTTYIFTVKAADVYSVTAASSPFEVTTLDPTFDLLLPSAPELRSIDGDHALVSLAEVAGADSYILNVYRKERGEASSVETLDFSAGSALPEGWESTASSTISMSGYYGVGAPALVLNADGLYIQTPVYPDDITGLTFWLRGRSDVSGNTLTVFGSDGYRWQRLADMEIPTAAQTVTIDPDLLEGCRSIRIVYNKTSGAGNAVIDDIEVQRGATIERLPLAGFDELPLASAGEVRVGPLSENGTFYATYAALAEDMRSRLSPELRIVRGEGSALSAPVVTAALAWRIAGATLEVTAPAGEPVSLYTPSGIALMRTRAGMEGTATLPLPAPGVYLLVAGTETVKFIL